MLPLQPLVSRAASLLRPGLVPRTLSTSVPTLATSPLLRDRVRVVEVGPRDGLQNEKSIIPFGVKVGLIERLARTGLLDIEAGAFVSPKWVPQMTDSSKILEHLLNTPPLSPYTINYSFLVPNLKGLEAVLSVCNRAKQDPFQASTSPESLLKRNPMEVSIFLAATDSFSLKNTNCTMAESLDRVEPVVKLATSHGIPVRAYISVVLGCPYDGPDVSPITVADLTHKLLDLGCREISLGDTTGMGTAPRTQTLFRVLQEAGVPMDKLAGHFHDTYGQALVNCAVALDAGVRVFDSSVAGLGGCPYAKGATGNVATEDVVYFLQSMGIECGVDLERIVEVGNWISEALGKENGSRVGKAVMANRERRS